MIKGKIFSKDIAYFLDSELIGDNLEIDKVHSINKIEEKSLCFISSYGLRDDISSGALIIVPPDYEIDENSKNSYIKIIDPRGAFYKAVEKFFYRRGKGGISKTSVVHDRVTLGRNVCLGEYVVIEEGAVVGDNSIIGHNAVILENCAIGNNCVIYPGTVIGGNGLMSLRDEQGNRKSAIHFGRVVVEDYVDIGANSTIQRGTFEDTVIKKYTKTGPQVNIGHNVFIDENCGISGQVNISGNVKIGRNCFIGANCSIKDGLTIGENCTVGIGSVVTGNIEDNITVMGLEATKLKGLVKFKKKYGYF